MVELVTLGLSTTGGNGGTHQLVADEESPTAVGGGEEKRKCEAVRSVCGSWIDTSEESHGYASSDIS